MKRVVAVLGVAMMVSLGCSKPSPCRPPDNVCTGKDNNTGQYSPPGCVNWKGGC